ETAARLVLADRGGRADDVLRQLVGEEEDLAEVVDDREEEEVGIGHAVLLHRREDLPDVEQLASSEEPAVARVDAEGEPLDEIPDPDPAEDRPLVLDLERADRLGGLAAVALVDRGRLLPEIADAVRKGERTREE